MTCRKKHTIENALCHLFPSSWLSALAREIGLVQRQRKVDPVALFWTLVLGFGIGQQPGLASLRRAYAGTTGVVLSASSFYDRFTDRLVVLLSLACERALQSVLESQVTVSEGLSAFRDILISDATVIRLHDLLQPIYAACRTNHTQAAAKLHLVLSVLGKSEQQIRLTSERKREAQVWTIGEWVQGRLLLFDLGYFSYALLDRIHHWGGFFVSRLKDNCDPTILAVLHGTGPQLVGQSLKSILGSIRRDILDVQVEVTYKKRRYRGKRRRVTQTFRVVGLKHPITGTYHLYITNIPADHLAAEAIGRLYAARWLVELVFKQLKSFYQLASCPSTKPHIVHALIYRAIVTMIVSRQIEQVLQRRLALQTATDEATREIFPLLRLAAVLHAFSGLLLQVVFQKAQGKRNSIDLTEMVLRETRDPNRNRNTLLQRLQDV